MTFLLNDAGLALMTFLLNDTGLEPEVAADGQQALDMPRTGG